MLPLAAESAIIQIPGFAPDLQAVTLKTWDTYAGTVTNTQTNYPVSNGSISIPVSNLTTDMAFQIINPNAPTPTPSPTPTLIGDLNGDLTVNIQDIIILINEIFTPSGVQGSDINSDGKVDILDVISLINLIFS
ncbi:hypothetical protein COV24_00890 [candidate division WWE3 bacterium CG10_big_fil_rev_8_21_14_0_10_32_10]|uniref:Dockerin domain-containing protein n=1 Tax=candidate division WWE3 bacterium CG10_big_fil_rev_8_21_14_0_10_32_10 TaxID=1975090 RepID=A0A2H0RBD9_UNCKA|nr:MAG: hypothetical protein COV24_00890 [candidate division WWE3 bacterium CG10_big_fil_rev_8_21_14_0_10_32_10]